MIASAAEFIELVQASDPAVAARARVDSATTAVWLDVLRLYPEEAALVAMNKTLPVDVMDAILGTDDARARFLVAQKRKLPPELVDRLSTDTDEGIRLAAARHRNASRSTLERLKGDAWSEVRSEATAHLERMPET
jgi:hypothetical protein